MAQHTTHHWVRVDDVDLDLILTFDPEDVGDGFPEKVLAAYRKWSNTVKDIVEDGLETA